VWEEFLYVLVYASSPLLLNRYNKHTCHIILTFKFQFPFICYNFSVWGIIQRGATSLAPRVENDKPITSQPPSGQL